MGNRLQRFIYNLSAAAPLCFIFALVWYWQKKEIHIPCIAICMGSILIILFMISFAYGKRIETDDTERFEVVFQRFRKEQYISTSWVNLFFTNEKHNKNLIIR